MIILGIETSCDDTGLAIYDGNNDKLIGHILHSQTETHQKYGGVVPELASRDHISKVSTLLLELLKSTNISKKDIDAIAYTKGPGLSGALLVGATFAKSLSYAWHKPSIGIHHLEGHLLAPMLEEEKPSFPFLALLVSGGHTQLMKVTAVGKYEILGETLDDAAGEAFDKTAKLLGFGYPGGKIIAEHAQRGNQNQFKFPRPLLNRPNLDFSFSGLKTHVLNTVHNIESLTTQTKADICLEFEEAITDVLVKKCHKALEQTGLDTIVISGGVGANLTLRKKIKTLCKESKFKYFFPKIEFCTDNGAMIAYAGYARLKFIGKSELDKDFSINIKPRIPIEH